MSKLGVHRVKVFALWSAASGHVVNTGSQSRIDMELLLEDRIKNGHAFVGETVVQIAVEVQLDTAGRIVATPRVEMLAI